MNTYTFEILILCTALKQDISEYGMCFNCGMQVNDKKKKVYKISKRLN